MSTETATAPAVDQQRLVRRLAAIESELREIKAALGLDGWVCECCKNRRPSNWYSYRVRRDKADKWMEPACALCAREMWSEGPFPPPNVRVSDGANH